MGLGVELLGSMIQAHSRYNYTSSNSVIPVTEDFKFFKGFVRSADAHDIPRDLVVSVLKINKGVTVFLAGEIIDGVEVPKLALIAGWMQYRPWGSSPALPQNSRL